VPDMFLRLPKVTRVTSQTSSIHRGTQCRCLHCTTCHYVTSFIISAYQLYT